VLTSLTKNILALCGDLAPSKDVPGHGVSLAKQPIGKKNSPLLRHFSGFLAKFKGQASV
jgi:hypothetical protein